MKNTLLLFVCISAFTSLAQNFNRPVPDNTFQYEYNEVQGITDGFMLASMIKPWSTPMGLNYIPPYTAIYDSEGYLFWYGSIGAVWVVDFKYYPGFGLYSISMNVSAQGDFKTLVLNEDFEAIDTLYTQNNTQDVHDVQLLNNGNWLLSTVTWDTVDLSAYTFDGTQGSTQTVIRGYGYEEIDPSGTLISEWDSNDHLDPTETYDFWGYSPNDFDYCHGNAYEEDTDGHILVSHRHLNSIHKIHRQTGEIIWRLGGEQSDFIFSNDGGFSGQHDIRRLPNGDYSIFDNGNMTATTRGVTYSLDTMNWIATKTGEYIHPTDFNANAMGSYRVLEDGREILGYGFVFRPYPSSVIVDANHNILSEYYFQDSVLSYRTLLQDLTPPERPEITCEFNGVNWELHVLGSHNDYAWSTGESSASIQLTQTGTYQVWVDQGIGMIGSLPFEVTDINNPPCSMGLTENIKPTGSFRWCNLLGQEVEDPVKGQIYLKVYSSGSIEKVIFQ